MSRVAALVPAAGDGRRLGLGPKAFVRVAGRTLLEHAAGLLAPWVEELILAVPVGFEQRAASLVPESTVVAGGASRQATVDTALARTEADLVLIHDVARPLTPPDAVRRVLDAARRDGAASAVLAVADTLHDVIRDGPVPRERLRLVQTPQAFDRAVLAQAHAHARRVGVRGSDDAQLVRALGRGVTLVAGSPLSHKLTEAHDLDMLEALARGLASARTSLASRP